MVRNKNKGRIFRFNRRIRGRTDYRQRLRFLESGLTRLVVRKSNNSITVQFVDYDPKGDKVVSSARALDLGKYGFDMHKGNLAAAYLTGYLAGKRALKSNVSNDCIVDKGLNKVFFQGRIFAAVKGAMDAGINVRAGEIEFAPDERLKGEHLKAEKASQKVDSVKKEIDKL